MKRLIVALCLIVALLGGIYGALSLTRPTQKPTAAQTVQEPLSIPEIHRLVNEERVKVGQKPLILDERLSRGAQEKADELLSTGYYKHDNQQGVSGTDYSHKYIPGCREISENLQYNADSSALTVNGWILSPLHKEAMLNSKYTIVGYGISGRYVVQHMC